VKDLQRWLGKQKWDVIHFNFGLHDIKRVNGPAPNVLPDEYERNLREIVRQLKQTGARLIWASTTPAPFAKMRPTRYPDNVAWYNQIAAKVMKENHVEIDDLYGFVLPREKEIQRPSNVHYTDAGYPALAKKVVDSINK